MSSSSKRVRPAWVLCLALVQTVPLAALTNARTAHAQEDDDWSVTRRPGRPTRPGRPSGPVRPSGPARPGRPTRPARPATPPGADPGAVTQAPPTTATPGGAVDPQRARRDRMIQALSESVIREAADDSAPMGVLLRLVRERDGSIDALVTDFERRVRATPDAPGPHLALGHLYREAGRFEDAVREYESAERTPTGAAAAARSLGAIYRRMARVPDARAAYERSLARAGADRRAQADTLRQLIELSLEANDANAARGFHQRLVALDRQSNTVRRELADALLQRQMYAAAVQEFQALARAMAGDNRVLPPVLRDLGRAYAGNNQHDEALASYRRALSLAGADAGIRRELYDAITEVFTARNALPEWIAELERMGSGRDAYERAVLLGRLHEQAGNSTAAVAAYRRAIAARPNDVDAYVHVAQIYHQQGQREEEIAAYRRLTAIAPREPDFVAKLADLLLAQGQRDEALRVLSQASARAGGDPNVHERLAEVYARNGRQQEALREIELVARLDPSSPAALTALGRQYMELGQRERALATWRRIYETARDRARGAVALAEVYADNAMLQESIEMYREAVRLRPEAVDYHRGLAGALERTRQFEEAVREWRRVIELSARDRDLRRIARESIVRIWGIQNRVAAQVPELERLFSAEPPDLEAGRDLAESLLRLRRGEEAERVLRRVVTLDPADVASLVSLERVLTQRGDLAGAIDVLRRLTEADPRRAREWYQRMGQHALALHRDDEAIEYATRAVQLNDQDATAHLRLAELYRARGDMGHAIASLRRAIELNDRLFATYFELADLYLGVRDEPREAVALYRRVVQLAPDDDYVLRAGRRAVQIAPAAGLGNEIERELAAASAAQPTRTVFRRLLVSWYDTAARMLINRAQQGTPDERAGARRELTRLGARALSPMLDALADPDPAQQRIALDVLGYLGNPNASGALLAVAEGSAEIDVRRRALVAAGALGDPRALSRLIALQSQRDPQLATAATWAIGHVRTPAATAALVRTLGPEHMTDLRVMAALSLAGTRDAGTRAVLRRVLSDEGQASVRAAAAYALGGSDRASASLLLASLETSSIELRKAAAIALGVGGDVPEAAAALSRALFHPDPALRRSAAAALAQLGHVATPRPALEVGARPRAGGARLDEQRDELRVAQAFDDPANALSASRMLDAVLDPPVAPERGVAALVRHRAVIARAASDALSSLVERAQVVLAAFAETDALAPLATGAAVRGSREARAARAEMVEGMVPALTTLLRHNDARVRRAALRVLAQAPTAESTRAIERAFGDDDEAIAAAAVEALGSRRGDEAALSALTLRVSDDARWSVRASAAAALGALGDERAVEALARVAQSDANAYVRVAAVRALRGLASDGQRGARAALERAARDDTDPSVRAAAAE